MNKSRRGGAVASAASVLAVALLAALVPGDARGQDNNAACSLRGKDTVLATGATVKQCLDLSGLNGKTVVIPKNVTRIDNTGFALCETSETRGGLADIVYVMDQSGSMQLKYIWISPNGLDTLYINDLGSCRQGYYGNTDLNSFGSVTVMRGSGTFNVPKINPAKSPRDGNCGNFISGDPFYQRDIAFREAIKYQADRSPSSRAGYVGFAGDIIGPTPPVQLNTPANLATAMSNITITSQNNTNYLAGLDQAKKWLVNPALSPNPTKAIIFVSDGLPTRPQKSTTYPRGEDSYLDLLDPAYAAAPGAMPPVFGIFMGQVTPDTLKLSELSRLTGGRFYLIPPHRPDSLRTVVEGILNIIFRQYQPSGSRVKNTTIIPNQEGIAGPASFTRQDANSWLINYGNPVGLVKEASNAIDLSTTMRDASSGDTLGKRSNFLLSTTGPDEQTNKNLPGTPFSVVCHELPPDVNVVKKAYIRDMNGDGAGDKVFFVFSRPLLALPGPDSVIAYWNKVAPDFQNKKPPVLSFLAGSGNTVLVADFTAMPFGKNLTSIPEGEVPIGILPPGGVLQGQRPAIEDSIGPVLVSGVALPYDPSKGTVASANQDTLVVTVSETMRTRIDWTNLIYWGKPVNGECNDMANAKQLMPTKDPAKSDDGTTFTIVAGAGQDGGVPVRGDCIYLNVDGTQRDMHGNIPPVHGVVLGGRLPARVIELFRGYPPVVGLAAEGPGFLVANNDPRRGDNGDFSTPDKTGKFVTNWIPPFGYPTDPLAPFTPDIPDPKAPSVGSDPSVVGPMPPNISAVQVVSTGKYIAYVSIFDAYGSFMKRFIQPFGYHGEMVNTARLFTKGQVSYLVWDLKDQNKQKAGQGVYIWKVLFVFENGNQEIQYTRTGVTRNPAAW